jgi:tRNA 2-thiouridine synthesizing protein E
MNALILHGRTILLDKDGYLQQLDDWSREVAEALAIHEEMTLDERHWEIIDLLQAFYAEFQLAPSTRPLVKYANLKLGADKGNGAYLNQLFKGTPAKLAAKLAGLPRPANCL